MSPTHDLVILGGGLAGLTLALEASRLGRHVVLLEGKETVGGLARTLVFGDYRFDIGGHRFHSQWPHVTDWLRDVMEGNLLEVARRSRIRLNGRYVDYPLQLPNALIAFHPVQAIRVLASYLKASLRRSTNGHESADASFEDWVVHRFGQALYGIYFRPYTEKVWGMSCTELSADWAQERIQLPSLTAAVKSSLWRSAKGPRTLVSRFLYPRLGIGMIPESLARQAEATGRATVRCSSQVFRLEQDEAGRWLVHYRQGDAELTVQGRRVISTIPLPALLSMLPPGGEPPPCDKLQYRDIICVFLAIDGPRISADTWTYFPDGDIGLGRTHEPPNWSPAMAPTGKTSLCVEVFSTRGDETWQRPDAELADGVLADLSRQGFLARERVQDAWVLRVPEAYPCYRIGYTQALRVANEYLARRWPTLHLLGRTGTFQYLNMDAVIHQAIEMARTLAADHDR